MYQLLSVINVQVPIPVKFAILIAVVVAGSVYFVLRPSAERTKAAQEYLYSLATDIKNICTMNYDYEVARKLFYCNENLSIADFDKAVLEEIKKDAHDYVKTSISYSVDHGKLDPFVGRLVNNANIDALIDIIIDRDFRDKASLYEAVKNGFKKENDGAEQVYNEINSSSTDYIDEMTRAEEEASKAAQEAEDQEEEPSDPVKEEYVETFADDGAIDENYTEEDTYEVIDENESDEPINTVG